MSHVTVLLHETVEAVVTDPDGIYVDCTLGRGGHAARLLSKLSAHGRLIALDRDPSAIAACQSHLGQDARVSLVHSEFDQLASVLPEGAQVTGILADLGVSSPQLDEAARGFSFQSEGPLDMRMNPEAGQSAADWLRTVKHPDLARVLRVYGDEKHAVRIATAILQARDEAPLETTAQLAEVVKKAHPNWDPARHPATRAFQAIRIHVNDELGQVERLLPQAIDALAPGGRLAVISFHSLEDRLVKRFIRDGANPPGDPLGLLPQPAPILKAVGKAVYPTADEIQANPRSRSAVLRVAEKVGA